MPTARRSRMIAAPPADVWRVLDDPEQLPRWWPEVRRVEAVGRDGFTQVLFTAKGRAVRIDLTVAAREPGRLLRWEQDLAGTPFEHHLAASAVELRIEPAGSGTSVMLEQHQQLRGMSRTGGWLLRRASAKRLERALAGLSALLS